MKTGHELRTTGRVQRKQGSPLPVKVAVYPLRDGDKVVKAPATLSVSKVGADGKLEFVRKYDLETNGKIHYWMGMFALKSA